MLQPADGLFVLAPGGADAPGLRECASRRAAPASCSAAASANWRSCSMGPAGTSARAGVGCQLANAGRQRVQLPLPALQIVANLPQPALRFRNSIAPLPERGNLLQTEVFGQADHGQALTPTSPRGLELFLGGGRSAGGRFGLLAGRAAAGVQRGQLLEGRQILLGGLQPARDRSAPLRQLPIQGVAVGLGLRDLQLQHAELLLAAVEMAGVRAFEQNLSRGRGAACRPNPKWPAPSRTSR